MLSNFGWYLVEASFCLVAFAAVYRLRLARLTHFAWNRGYLLMALAASLVLPLLDLPDLLARLLTSEPLANPAAKPLLLRWAAGPAGAAADTAQDGAGTLLPLIMTMVATGYAGGVLLRLAGTGRSLCHIARLVRRYPKTRLGAGWLVQLPAPGRPAFSFGPYVFLSPQHAELDATERQLLLAHEQVHVRQWHTLDLLFFEAAGALLWVHPLLPYLKRQLKNVHEYLADQHVARRPSAVPAYGRLLLRLASGQPSPALGHAFSDKQIVLRLAVLTQPPSSPMKKFRFLLVVPVAVGTWLTTASFGAATLPPAPAPAQTTPGAKPTPVQLRIGRIDWKGNKRLTTAQLGQLLGLKPGDAYDAKDLAARLNYRPDGRDITSQYMDQGYMFFSVTPTATTQANGTVDLALTLSEGPQVRLRRITVTGNQQVATAQVLAAVPLKSGELFSRAKLMQTQQALAALGPFDAEKIGITPKPVVSKDGGTDQADIELVVVEKSR